MVENQTHCPACGAELIEKELKNEGIIPYCPVCNEYRFPMFNTAVSMIVIDPKSAKVLLIRQYGRPFNILVAGYVNRGERMEDAVVREIKEETGMTATRVRFNRTKFFAPSNTLMCNFTAWVSDAEKISPNEEIDAYEWFSFAEARRQIKPDSLASDFLDAYLEEFGVIPLEDTGKKDPLAWEEISCEHLIKDEWIDLRRSAYRFPDGSVFEPYYSYSRRDYAVIVATDETGRYICVRQYRQGIRRVTTEFCAGGLERGDGKQYGPRDISRAEDALAAAKRELMEETGYETDEWEHLLSIPSNATMADNYGHIYVAKNCRQVAGQSLDETEFLNVLLLSEEELKEEIQSGEFPQAMHVLAYLLFKETGKNGI